MNKPTRRVAQQLERLARTPIADNDDDLSELSKAELRILKRRLADAEDRTRYLLASELSPQFALYYLVADDVWVMNQPQRATLFKRKAAAKAIRKLLGPNTTVVKCKVDARGKLAAMSVDAPKRKKAVRKQR
jgi:hypothetical protein